MTDLRISGVCYNKYEAELAEKIENTINEWGKDFLVENRWFIADDDNPDTEKFKRVQGTVREWTAERFKDTDVIIYIAPVVRVVRYIGNLIEDQAKDPAVIAVDVTGKYCIPILSGRRGEAYDIARVLDSELDMTFINVTTPNDSTQFDIAKYAEVHDFVLSNPDYATEVSTAIHAGDEVGFFTDYTVVGNLPGTMVWKNEGKLGVYVSPSYDNAFFSHTLWLIPRCITVVVRCSKEVSYKQIEKFILDAMKSCCFYPEAISEVLFAGNSESRYAARRFAMEYGTSFAAITPEYSEKYFGKNEKDMIFDRALEKRTGRGKTFIKEARDENMECSILMKNVYIRF